MDCTSIERQLAGLQEDEQAQKDLISGLSGHPLEAAQARLQQIDEEIAQTKVDLANCRIAAAETSGAAASSASTVGFVGTVEVETRGTPRLWCSLTASADAADWVRIGDVRAWFTLDLSSDARAYALAMLPLLLEAMRGGDQVKLTHGGAAAFQKQEPGDAFEANGVRVLRPAIRF